MLASILFSVNLGLSSQAVSFPTVLVIPRAGTGGRASLPTDAVQQRFVDEGMFSVKEGDTVRLPNGSVRTWEKITPGANGEFRSSALQGGWAYAELQSPTDRIAILEAAGHSMVYVNGVPEPGDPYSYGWLRLPVRLTAGTNRFLFAAGRGSLRAALLPPRSDLFLSADDATLPDFEVSDTAKHWAAVVLTNATDKDAANLTMESECGGKTLRTPLPTVPRLGVRKVGFQIFAPGAKTEGTAKATLKLMRNGTLLDQLTLQLRIRKPESSRKITFISQIDGSVQYYALQPCSDAKNRNPALILTLHGASVEAIGQADAYSPKSWANIAAPTNRRPYGFDWEDWGRMDAIEVLELAKKTVPFDPRRVYLTGHSMGGHGTYQIGCLFPGLFAAIGPSAAWISFDSYTGSRFAEAAAPAQQMMERAMSPSRTESLIQNYAGLGVYILHGDADDNVPVTEARKMKQLLSGFHTDVTVYEQPGAGHWWENSDEPGAECVDWPAMFDFFAQRQLASNSELRHVRFSTPSPAVSSRRAWIGIEQQIRPYVVSTVDATAYPLNRRFEIKTDNVSRLRLETDAVRPGGQVTVNIDGQTIERISPPQNGVLFFARSSGGWALDTSVEKNEKGSLRGGAFKESFRNRMVFVYGTHGSPDENRWSFEKARFDAETFYYRGNGSVDLVSDDAFLRGAFKDRNAVFFGNESVNAAWKKMEMMDETRLDELGARLGTVWSYSGPVVCLFTRPSAAGPSCMNAFVGGSDARAMRAADRLPYFVSGTAYPDAMFCSPDVWQGGANAILAAGFFGNDWMSAAGDWFIRK